MLRVRRPSVLAVLLTVFGVAVFCALGVWQLRRAAYKVTVFARFDHAASAPLVSLPSALSDRKPDAYPHVKVTGRLDGNHVYLLDDQMRAGKLGVMVFVPFTPAGVAHTLLVNMGFLARRGPDATRLPVVPHMPGQTVTLTGIYAPPPLPGLKLGGDPLPRQKTWPKVVTFIDIGEIAKDLNRRIDSHVLLMDPSPQSGYVRTWTANVMPPARHRAYALQWFTFAAVAIVIFFVMHRVKRDSATTDVQE